MQTRSSDEKASQKSQLEFAHRDDTSRWPGFWAEMDYTVSGKKGATLFLPVTLRNANRFSKFFHHHTLQ